MEYMTVKQAAEIWGLSERRVQKYCTQGRIEGATKFGVAWQIPVDAVKPLDGRTTEAKKAEAAAHAADRTERAVFPDAELLMPLLNTPFKPGQCRRCIEKMPNEDAKNIAQAEYYYFSGHPEQAAQEAERYLNSKKREARLSACLIYAYASLSLGQIGQTRSALEEVRDMLVSDKGTDAQRRTAEAFIAVTAAVLLHLPLPDGIPPAKDFLPLLPFGLRLFALYVVAHYQYLKGQYERSIGTVNSALAMGAEAYPIPAVYLHLVAVMDHMSLRETETAEKHLLDAWELARPDDLIEGLGEHHGLLGGMLEAVIKPQWPDDFKRIIEITCRFSEGWRKIHNPVTGHAVADNLTTTEFAIAMLAARGWTNKEIAEHMGLSVNTIKQHISVSLQKLCIQKRKDLKKYMLV